MNDQLKRAERLRLESLSQAIQITALCRDPRSLPPTIANVIEHAELIEKFLYRARESA